MRPDVKLGVIVATAVVFVIGGYFAYRDKDEPVIPVASGPEALSDAAGGSTVEPPKVDLSRPETARRAKAEGSVDGSSNSGVNQPLNRRVPTNVRLPNRDVRSTAKPPRDGLRAEQPISRGAELDASGAIAGPPASATSSLAGKSEAKPAGPSGDPNAAGSEDPANSSKTDKVAAGEPAKPVNEGTSPGDGAEGSTLKSPVTLSAPSHSPAGGSDASKSSSGAVETHRVQPGDTLVTLSEQYYGSARFLPLLQSANPQIIDPRNLPVGLEVKIPARPMEPTNRVVQPAGRGVIQPVPADARPGATAGGASSAARTYVVKAGDSFYRIARDVLGDANRWQELFELNRDRVKGDAKSLQIGQEIVLPVK